MTQDDINALLAAKAAAEADSQAKSKLIAHTSHEIRTQLSGVLGIAQAALETRLTEEQREFMDLIVRSGDAILTLVNDLLDVSRIEAGMLTVESVPFSLTSTVEDIVSTFRSSCQDKGLQLEVEWDDAAPEQVVGDPGRVRQVLANLLSNAVRFTDSGDVVLTVAIEEHSGNAAKVGFTVADTGVGIAPDMLDRVFDPYAQAESGGRQRGGTGLGLAISRQLAELMGGSLTVESEVGVGSRFTLSVPFVLATDAESHSSVLVVSELDGLPILVASDRADDLSRVLVERGAAVATVGTAADAERALAQAIDQPFALAIVDSDDPLWIAGRLRAERRLDLTHLMLLTPIGERGDAALCRELRVAGYLTQPYSPEDVAIAAQEVICGPAPNDLTTLVTRHWIRERRRRLSLLVVDDSPTLRMTASRQLERRGHSVRTVAHGGAAVEAASEHRYDAIVMDLNMPGVDGFEATRLIRQAPFGATVPIIAVTAQVEHDTESRILGAGASALLPRPFEMYELVSAIERELAKQDV